MTYDTPAQTTTAPAGSIDAGPAIEESSSIAMHFWTLEVSGRVWDGTARSDKRGLFLLLQIDGHANQSLIAKDRKLGRPGPGRNRRGETGQVGDRLPRDRKNQIAHLQPGRIRRGTGHDLVDPHGRSDGQPGGRVNVGVADFRGQHAERASFDRAALH